MADAPEKDLAKDGLLAIAPRDPTGRPTLGGIPLYKKLGQGGMGAVYLGKHPRLGVEVAVKILPFHLADQDPNAIEYFMREANVAARLNHPSLVRIFDVNVDGDPKAGSAIWYLVMEFVSGLTGGKLIRERMKGGKGPLSEADALDLLLTVSDGLAAAHEENFVHRDIKPENIIIPLSPEGEPQFRKAKLMDLGLAKLLSEERSIGLTGTNVAMGTPGYMAPEQAENAKGAGPPSDVFAMGATLYTLLTGSAPFTGTTVLHVLKKTSEEPHPPLRNVNPAVSRPTEVLVDTCLAKRPEARYASAGVLREALKACRQSLGGEISTDRTLASLQNLASVASTDPTVRAPSPSILPSASPRTGVTAKTPEPEVAAPSVPAPAPAAPSSPGPARRSKAPLLVAAAAVALLAAAGIGAFIVFRPGGRGSSEKTDPGKKEIPPDAAGAEFAQAMRDAEGALNDEDYAKAEALYKEARHLRPQSSEAEEGERRARQLTEQASSVATAVGDAEALAVSKDYASAWQKLRTAIDRHPDAITLRTASAKLALDHGTYAWLGLALNDANVALRLAGPKRKPAATQLRDKLEAKKKSAEAAGGVLPQIQLAIDRGDWDAAEKLLDQVEPAERGAFTRAIEQGRKWQAAMARGKKAEESRQWPEALAAYHEALLLKSDPATDEAIRRAEQEVKSQYGAECDGALHEAKGGRFDEARRHLAAAEQLTPSGLRHNKLKDEIQFLEHLAEARKLRRDGKNADALAAARRALALRGDSPEARTLVEELGREGPLAGAKAALAGGDRATAARLARAAAADNPAAPELKDLERELWPDLFAEKAKSPAAGPVDDLAAASDGRIVGTGG
ncbi:MAG TPA: protein kinase, partial [Planctomycetota bacterium]